MRTLAAALALLALTAAACGGDDNGEDSSGDSNDGGGGDAVVIAAAEADRVAHEALPALEDLPGGDWLVIGEDEFGADSGGEFLELIEGTPECESLEDLATLQGVFGGGEEAEPVGRAQVEFENQDPDALIPTSVEVEVEIEESAGGSRAQFDVVRELFESDETSACLIAVLNAQFSEGGPAGLEIEVSEGSGSADPPQDGARIAFDLEMSFLGEELELAMELYFWPYGNASVQAQFLGSSDALDDIVGDMLEIVDENLQTAATE